MTYYTIINSPAGELLLTSSNDILTGLYFMNYKKRPEIAASWTRSEAPFQHVVHELSEYFKGNRHTFTFKFNMQGTDFQKLIWAELFKIPYGKTISYKDIAVAIGKPNAMRAVGTAVGRNPVCIIGPCHRVLATGGGIGGYAGGIEAKKILLSLESPQ